MADPLSIAASITGFIQFTTPILAFVRSISNASKDQRATFEEIERECTLLEHTLSELKSLVDKYHDAGLEKSTDCVEFSFLVQCLEECKASLQIFMNKLQAPGSSKLATRLKWPLRKEQVGKLVESVEKCKQSITTLLSVKQSQVLTILQAEKEEKLRTSIIEWLWGFDVHSPLEDAQAKRYKDTGAWFLQGDILKEYQEKPGKHLWLYGIPGCGKTVLGASIISALQRHCQHSHNLGLAFFMISFRESQRQTVFNILKSLVAQLCQKLERIPRTIEDIYKANWSGPSRSCLFEILRVLAKTFDKTYLVLDALDEILQTERSALLNTLQEIIAEFTNFNLVVLSRRESFIVEGLPLSRFKEICITTSVVDADIELYISYLMKEDPKFKKLSVGIQERIRKALTTGARGMFRWVDCQIDRLRGCRNANAIDIALSTLPPTLDETYRRILLGIPDDDVSFAAKALACLAATWTTLSVEQLAEAVIVEPDCTQINHGERFMDPHDLVAILGGLATVELRQGWRVVTLAHYSVLEYLTSERIFDIDLAKFNKYLHDADAYFASLCKTYLIMDVLRTKTFCTEYNLDTYNAKYPLFTFACSGIGHQMKKIQSKGIQKKMELSLAKFLYDEPYLWDNLNTVFFKQNNWYSPMPLFVELEMHSAVVMGIIMGIHPERRTRTSMITSSLENSLESAISQRDYEMIRFILHHAAHDQGDSGYKILGPPLVFAVRNRDYELVKLFIDNGSDDHDISGYQSLKSNKCSMALHRAVYTHYPSLELIQALLDSGCNINSMDLNGTVLMSAVENSYNHWLLQPRPTNLALVDFLISSGAKLDPVYPREDGRLYTLTGRLLIRAAWSSSPEVIRLLLNRGASFSAPIRNPNLVLPLYYMCPESSSDKKENIYLLMGLVAAAASNATFSDKILSILVSLKIDINGLECIIGWGKSESDLRLEYCTALDYYETLYPLYRAKTHKGFGLGNEADSSKSIQILRKYGGRKLPREPVPPRIWKLMDDEDLARYRCNSGVPRRPSVTNYYNRR